jgi:hypothetical protein
MCGRKMWSSGLPEVVVNARHILLMVDEIELLRESLEAQVADRQVLQDDINTRDEALLDKNNEIARLREALEGKDED